MNIEKFIKENKENKICLEDENISLEAKGFFYLLRINSQNENFSFNEFLKTLHYDKNDIYSLIIELIENNYLSIKILED